MMGLGPCRSCMQADEVVRYSVRGDGPAHLLEDMIEITHMI
jgi:hypothetical protein